VTFRHDRRAGCSAGNSISPSPPTTGIHPAQIIWRFHQRTSERLQLAGQLERQRCEADALEIVSADRISRRHPGSSTLTRGPSCASAFDAGAHPVPPAAAGADVQRVVDASMFERNLRRPRASSCRTSPHRSIKGCPVFRFLQLLRARIERFSQMREPGSISRSRSTRR